MRVTLRQCERQIFFFLRFAEEDVELIQHCFQYTAAVLHSTLAVQNEQRLKKQTQVSGDIVWFLYSRYSITHLSDENSDQ